MNAPGVLEVLEGPARLQCGRGACNARLGARAGEKPSGLPGKVWQLRRSFRERLGSLNVGRMRCAGINVSDEHSDCDAARRRPRGIDRAARTTPAAAADSFPGRCETLPQHDTTERTVERRTRTMSFCLFCRFGSRPSRRESQRMRAHSPRATSALWTFSLQ